MQYPPQQQPPIHSPSEVYAPQYPSVMPGQEIIIYPNRTQAIVRMTICGVVVAFGIMLFVGVVALLLILGTIVQIKYIAPLIVYLALLLPVLVFGGWVTWSMAQLLKPTPLLIINHQGITIGKMPMLSGFFIPWHEIEAIHASIFIYKYFCIRPKDSRQFLKRFNILERFNRLSNTIFGVPPLLVPQVFLERPIEEILGQLQIFYAYELNTHRIQLV